MDRHGWQTPPPLRRPKHRVKRTGRWAILPLAAVIALSSLGQQPAVAAARTWNPPATQDVAGIPVYPATVKSPKARWSAEASAVRGPQKVTWPTAASTRVTLGSGPVRAGGLPVTLKLADTGEAARTTPTASPAVSVTMHDRAVTAKAGIDGVLVSLDRDDARAGSVPVSMTLDYAPFASAFGADWASRLRLVRRPACVLTSPEEAACQSSSVVPTIRDGAKSTLSAQVSLSSAGATVLSAEAGVSGDNGDYSATSLSPSGTWQVSQQTGDFSWSYPLRMVPGLGGPAPSVSLGYSSGSIDGRTATTNNQGSWIGDGWDSWPGYIERTYNSCADDNPDHKTGDQCWFNDNATLSLNGHAGELIKSGSVWRLKSDDGTKIEKLTDANRGNGDNDNEYWKVTTTDGVQYFFGYHRLPGWVSGNPVTDSTWTVPVYGDDSGEPCYNATFASAYCSQAWRWNLDYVVDPHGNSEAYFYQKETGAYGRDNTPSQRTTYDRGGWLDRIDYGMRNGSEYAQAAPMRVKFDTAERCLSGCWSGAAWTSDPTTSAWPDTPWDQYCKAAPCTTQGSPAFFSARRLTKVTTQIRNGTSSYADVESWTLRQEFLNAGTGEGTPMWLRGITHTGHVTTAGGSVVADPEITFDPGAEPLPNRVDGPGDGRSALNRWRIKAVHTETGGDIIVTYSGPDCTRTTLPTPETNTKRCMPSYYAPSGDPTLDWFHKYVVTRVDLDDITTDQPTDTTFYDYLDAPAWAYNTDEITKDKFRTWGQWRGYGKVQVRHGDPTGLQSAVETWYLRGMDGDKAPSQPGGVRDVQVSDPWGGTVEDHSALQGFELAQITYNGSAGAEVSSTVNRPWKSGPTATRTRNGVTTEAWMTNTAESRERTALAAGGYRTTKTATAYNSDGLVTTRDDFGDEAVTGDETCARTLYARNDAIWMIDKVSQNEGLSGTCANAATPAAPATVLARQRTFYDTYVDDTSFGAAPTKGDVVRTEEIDGWNGSTPLYVPSARSKYDANGRTTEATDARGYKTTTAYTTANGGLVTQTVATNPLGHQVTTLKAPAWDAPVKITGANNEVTELTYDGLGRLTGVWLPGRDKATQTANTKFTYLVRNGANQPTAVTTENLLPTGSAYKKAINLYDGWLRLRQTQTQATGGGRLLTDTFYDTAGKESWTSQPYYDSTNASPSTTLGVPQGQIPGITQHVYDGVGRETTSIVLANGIEKWRSTTAYGGDRTHITPAAGGTATTSITDAQGNVVELRQYHSAADIGSTNASTFDATKYTYDLNGNMTKVEDAAHNQWTYAYDLHGKQTTAVDPDKGTTRMTYDAAGNLTSTTDNLNNVLWYTYDALNRKTSARDDSATGAIRAEWLYDTLPNGKGKPTSSTRWVSGNAYTSKVDAYDVNSRPTSSSIVLPSSEGALCAAGGSTPCVYTTTTSYKADGSAYQTTLPAAGDLPSEKLTFGYSDVGAQTTLLSAAQIYVYSTTYDKIGQLTQRVLGAYGSRVAITSAFDEPTRRLLSTNVVPELKPEAANYSWAYDNAGNVTKVTDAPAGQAADNQCYAYDYLRRVTSAWTPSSGVCATAPSVAGLQTGGAGYWQDFTYDVTGNRTTEVNHAAAGDTTFTYTMPASGATSVRPHTVTGLQMSAPGTSWTHGYTYDNAGNTATRLSDSGNQQVLTWDKEQHLSSIAEAGKTTSFVYDTDGNRMIRKDGDGTKTLYLPGGTEVKLASGASTATATRYYTHKDTQIAMRTAAGLTWLVGDHHGTAEISVKASDLTVSTRRTMPFGKDRGAAPTGWPATMDKGFVGGTKDPTGLTHLGAREYDPAIGRFLSVDPEIDYNDPQQLHGYAYSNNNPATMSDPSGRLWGWVSSVGKAVMSTATTVGSAVATAVVSTVETIKEDPLKFAAEVAIGVVAASFCGATAGLGCLIVAGAVAGAVCAGAEYTGEHVAKGDFSWGGLGESMAIGAIAGGAGAVLGKAGEKLLGPAVRAGVNGLKRAFGRSAEEAIEDGVEATARKGGSCLLSFDPATPVLLAGGAMVAIRDVKLGDRVIATDPISGVTSEEPVVALFANQDIDLADVTIVDGNGVNQTVHTTQKHPFWNARTNEWTPAGRLQPGDELRTPTGDTVTVVSVATWFEKKLMLNLGVSEIHSYYVMVGGTPVLVHNRTDDVTVYHYTDRAGYNGIRSSDPYNIRPGNSKNGAGPFFTNQSPEELGKRPGLFKKLGLTSAKSEYVMKLRVPKSVLVPLRGGRGDRVFSIPGGINVPRENVDYFGPTSAAGGC